MFEKKKLWMVMATAALVAACGGSSDPAPSTGGGDNPPGGGSDDQTLLGTLQLEENGYVIFNDMMLPLAGTFENNSETGGAWGQARGANSAPFQAFGFVLRDTVQGDAGSEEAVGRIAISLTEQAGSEGTGEVGELMQFLLTNVRVAAGTDGILEANVEDGGQLYVYGRNAANEVTSIVIDNIPTTAIRVADVSEFRFGAPAADSTAFVFDVNEAFSQATTEQQNELAALVDLSGRFDMNVTLSAANIVGTDGTTVLEGEDITVTDSGQTAVTGSGVSGNLWIGVVPPGQ